MSVMDMSLRFALFGSKTSLSFLEVFGDIANHHAPSGCCCRRAMGDTGRGYTSMDAGEGLASWVKTCFLEANQIYETGFAVEDSHHHFGGTFSR